MELPEVESVLRTLPRDLTHHRIERSIIRHPERVFHRSPSALRRRLRGARIVGFGRRGKYLLFHLDSAQTLVWHLGMSGRVAVDSSLRPMNHLLMAVKLEDGRFIKLYDARRFGRISLADSSVLQLHPFFHHTGYEYDDPSLTPEVLLRSAGRFRKKSVKDALLDQSFVAGLGNIYASEVLHHARIDPCRPVRTLSRLELARLLASMRSVLDEAIACGGTSVRDYVDAEGRKGGYQHRLKVYQRSDMSCLRCGRKSIVIRIVQSGRSTFFCPRCQR